MNKRIIKTSDEFVYDVLNSMVHHNEIIIQKKDLARSSALKNIVTRLGDSFIIIDDSDQIILKKIKNINVNIKFRQTFHN